MSFHEKVEQMKDEIINSTQEILRIRSVKDDPKEGMPFGEGINQCLEHALSLSEKLGFQTKNFDGYAGHAEFGEGEEVVGILVHLDVVPEGDNWTYPPYGGEIHQGKIYARGTIDDKGPAMACLYAMKAVKDSNLALNKKIRIIFGTDEESGWADMTYYLGNQKAPDVAFTPDADFPAIHAEKGILIFDLVKKLEPKQSEKGLFIHKIQGGNRANMVPDYCEAHITSHHSILSGLEEFCRLTKAKIHAEVSGDITVLKSYGISAHGSLPESGHNAISHLILFLNGLDLAAGPMTEFIKFYCDKIGLEFNGQSIGCGFEDEVSGKLIFNVGVIATDEAEIRTTVNIRYPVTYTTNQVYESIEGLLEDTEMKLVRGTHDMDPIYLPKDHELIKTLMSVYKKITGDEREPIAIGGGTYARAMSNAVAFGPLFPGQPELAHQKDEYISVEDLLKITEIYAEALYQLAK